MKLTEALWIDDFPAQKKIERLKRELADIDLNSDKIRDLVLDVMAAHFTNSEISHVISVLKNPSEIMRRKRERELS